MRQFGLLNDPPTPIALSTRATAVVLMMAIVLWSTAFFLWG